MSRFLDELAQETLIVPGPTGESNTAPSRPETTEKDTEVRPFQPPVLQKFRDMQDLLLMDPIHDVDEAGWPVAGDQEPG